MLEYIVRPFQAPNAHGTIIISSNPKETEERAIITWGGEATLPPVQYIETGFVVKKGREDFDEKNRDSEIVRIMGQSPEDDSPSYIDVQRSKKLYLDKSTLVGVNAASPGQSDYAASPVQAVYPGVTSTQPVEKTKATIQLNNNTTAAPAG